MARDVASVSEFDEALKGAKAAVAYFWADWAEPCKQMGAAVDELAKRHAPAVAFLRVEAEKLDALTERYAIETVPCCLVFSGAAAGQPAARVEGADPAALAQAVARLAPTAAASSAGATAPRPAAAANGAAAAAPAAQSVEERIKALLASAPLLLFMKGAKDAPYCGFSSRVVDALKATGHDFATFDIFSDEAVRQGLKEYSNWPTYPQLYLKGELVGGCDIVTEMAASGELKQLLGEQLGAGGGGSGAAAAVPASAAAAAAAAAAPQKQQQAAAAVEGLTPELTARLEGLVRSSPVVLFMKGAPDAPRCGFSRKVVEALRGAGLEFGSFDILTDEAVRQGLKEYSNWPTYPQLYANGELVGGCDIVLEMAAAGELKGAVEELLHRTT